MCRKGQGLRVLPNSQFNWPRTRVSAIWSSRKGVGRGQVVRGVQKDDKGPDAREDDESPQEEAVHYHGHKLPVLLQLGVGRGNCS